jgi:hypothetical protein
MYAEQLPPGGYPIAVKYIISYGNTNTSGFWNLSPSLLSRMTARWLCRSSVGSNEIKKNSLLWRYPVRTVWFRTAGYEDILYGRCGSEQLAMKISCTYGVVQNSWLWGYPVRTVWFRTAGYEDILYARCGSEQLAMKISCTYGVVQNSWLWRYPVRTVWFRKQSMRWEKLFRIMYVK